MSNIHRGATSLCVCLLLPTLAAVVGCGASSIPNTTVSGRVEVAGGIPLGEGKLILMPENPAPGQQPAGATIAADGSFSCYSSSGGNGIPPGSYKVMLSFPSGMASPHPLRETFKKYIRLDSTPLRLEVPAGGLSGVVLELENGAS